MTEGRLIGSVVCVSDVGRAMEQELFELFERYYDEVSPAAFHRDLHAKEWVIVLTEAASGRIKGFSTLCLMEVTVRGETVVGAFSGDTIVDRDAWGEHELVKSWYYLMEQIRERSRPRRLFWFLISKGYRTYLYLPTFFREFYPRDGVSTPPFEDGLIEAFGTTRYPDHFNPVSGVVEFERSEGRLKAGYAGIPAHRRNDANVAFFMRRNPGYTHGNELVCVAEFAHANFREFGARLVGADRPVQKGL